MATISITRETQQAPDVVFDIIADIESYPSFVPGVVKMARKNEGVAGTAETFEAEAFVKNKYLSGTVKTLVEADRAARTIRVKPRVGPFEVLVGDWRIEPTDTGGSRATCTIEMTSNIPLVSGLIQSQLGVAANAYADVFVARVENQARV